ncbi:MAG: GntR family transcriptional regulator, partial [Ensifer adhaerens]
AKGRSMTQNAGVPRSIERRSLHAELVERLRALITVGALANGQKIPEGEFCQRFGVSRTPLREALKVLAVEGVVTLRPNRGAVVNGLTAEELEQAFPVMGALEALAGEIACSMITSGEFAKICAMHETMVANWRRGDLQAYFSLNRAIHDAIVVATRNDVLIATYRSLSRRILPARYGANHSAERWAQAVEEHEAMLVALERRDGQALAGILKRHLANKLVAVKSAMHAEKPSASGHSDCQTGVAPSLDDTAKWVLSPDWRPLAYR